MSEPTDARRMESAAGARTSSPNLESDRAAPAAGGTKASRETAWRHWDLRALPAYWVFLFCATHFPRLQLDGPANSDKYLHTGAFALLALLFWRFAVALAGPPSPRFVWLAAALLLTYAAVDESLQQFVGRTTDLADWLADASGIVVVLIVMEVRRRIAVGRSRREFGV